MCLTCLPCIGASAFAGYKVNKTVDKAFSSKKPQEPTEPAFVTEARLRWNLHKGTPGAPTGGQQAAAAERPKRAERYSGKDQASRQRLAELVEAHRAGKAPGQQSARR